LEFWRIWPSPTFTETRPDRAFRQTHQTAIANRSVQRVSMCNVGFFIYHVLEVGLIDTCH
jgi:hypothetical protein